MKPATTRRTGSRRSAWRSRRAAEHSTLSPAARWSSRQPQRLVGLNREAPARIGHDERDRLSGRGGAVRAVHRLDDEMIEFPAEHLLGIDAGLRPHQLQLVTSALDDLR